VRNLLGKFVSAPQVEQESIFRTSFLPGGGDSKVGVVHLFVLDRVLKATTKKGLFLELRHMADLSCRHVRLLTMSTTRLWSCAPAPRLSNRCKSCFYEFHVTRAILEGDTL